jgi:hypothetical protein
MHRGFGRATSTWLRWQRVDVAVLPGIVPGSQVASLSDGRIHVDSHGTEAYLDSFRDPLPVAPKEDPS